MEWGLVKSPGQGKEISDTSFTELRDQRADGVSKSTHDPQTLEQPLRISSVDRFSHEGSGHMTNGFVVKLLRVCGGCLGTERR